MQNIFYILIDKQALGAAAVVTESPLLSALTAALVACK